MALTDSFSPASQVTHPYWSDCQMSVVHGQVCQPHRRLSTPRVRRLFIRHQPPKDRSVLPGSRSQPYIHKQTNWLVRQSEYNHGYCHWSILGWVLVSLPSLRERVRQSVWPESTPRKSSASPEDISLPTLPERVCRAKRADQSP